MTSSQPTVVLLDRDGVINRDSDAFIKSVNEWQPIPGSLEAIARLHQAGYPIGVLTNQSGIGRGLYTLETLAAIHRHMLEQVETAGGAIQQIYFCPHAPDEGCDCRKPRPGMLLDAAEYFACGPSNMIFVGDKTSDVDAARAAGAQAALVRTGYGEQTLANWANDELPPVFDDLMAFTDALLGGRT